MSDASIQRILDKLDDFGERIASLETTVHTLDSKVDKYNGVKDRTQCLEHAVTAIKDNCERVQKGKASRVQPWKALVFSLLGCAGGLILAYAFRLMTGGS